MPAYESWSVDEGSLDRVYHTKLHSEGLDTVTAHEYLPAEGLTTFKPQVQGVSEVGGKGIDALGEAFEEIERHLRDGPESAAWCIGQTNDVWFGFGLADFHTALGSMEERYERDDPTNPHNSETATMIVQLSGMNTAYLGLSMRPTSTNPTFDMSVRFLTGGIPLDTTMFKEIGEAFGGNSLSHASPLSAESKRIDRKTAGAGVGGGIDEIVSSEEVISQITKSDVGGTWVTALVIENPFRKNPSLAAEYLDEEASWTIENSMDHITDPEHVIAHLGQHHPPSEEYADTDYRIKFVEVSAGHKLTHGWWNTNLDIQLSYID